MAFVEPARRRRQSDTVTMVRVIDIINVVQICIYLCPTVNFNHSSLIVLLELLLGILESQYMLQNFKRKIHLSTMD